ncbi:metal-dependent hydrolase [Halostella salina]|uniref:metal-dependent hydrolase n=1 Tax=Halostella salina TaxID=1547897 RepID=UPI000EF76EC0|nr:metal-dependent hydrolase [Halostella salina]
MWPWEHLAVGYLLFSPTVRLSAARTPTGVEAAVLAVATQLPDLIDKPLAWWLGVLPSGLSLGHSVFFAVPAVAAALALTSRAGVPGVGVAFGVGYLSHLLGDVIFNSLGGTLRVGFLFWPAVSRASDGGTALLARVAELWGSFRLFLGTPVGRLYLLVEAAVLALALALWVADGVPGVRR